MAMCGATETGWSRLNFQVIQEALLKFKMDASCEMEAGDPEREDRGEEEGLHYQANLQLEFAFGSLGLYVSDLSHL